MTDDDSLEATQDRLVAAYALITSLEDELSDEQRRAANLENDLSYLEEQNDAFAAENAALLQETDKLEKLRQWLEAEITCPHRNDTTTRRAVLEEVERILQ